MTKVAERNKINVERLNEDIKHFPVVHPITKEMKTTHEGVSRLVMLDRYSFKDTKKEYVVYTKNEKDENENITVYVSNIDRSASEPKLLGVETEEEWNRIKDVLRELSKSEYVVAMRFHAIIIALLANIKTLAINYDIKVEKIASEFHLPVIDLQKDFENKFEELKTLDTDFIKSKVSEKVFLTVLWKDVEMIYDI